MTKPDMVHPLNLCYPLTWQKYTAKISDIHTVSMILRVSMITDEQPLMYVPFSKNESYDLLHSELVFMHFCAVFIGGDSWIVCWIKHLELWY